MLTFADTLFSTFVVSIILILKITTKILFFFANCFHRHIFLKHANAVFAKLRQKLPITKKALLQKNSILWNEKFLTINRYTPVSQSFRCHKLLETSTKPSHEFFLGFKKHSTFFCDTPCMTTKNVFTRQMESARNFQKHQRLPEK